MAKADDAFSIIDQISLSEAFELATARFGGSEKLAELRLRWEWMATGELPWDCEEWKAPDAEEIAEIARFTREDTRFIGYIVPSVPYRKGDPQFWRANLDIRWKKSEAYEKALGGAKALGIWMPRTRFLALLRGAPREREEAPEPTDAEAPAPSASAKWAAAATRTLLAEKKIAKDTTKTKAQLARLLEAEAQKDVKAGQIRRALKASYLEDQLRPWGIWPLDRFE